MLNCSPKSVKKVPCKNNLKCNGTYSKLDNELFRGKEESHSSLLYSRTPYKCSPTTTCLVPCINELPNIPKEDYTVYSKSINGIQTTDFDTMSINFKNQCPMQNNYQSNNLLSAYNIK